MFTMKPKKIVIFSPPLFGHFIPALELAKRLVDLFPVQIDFVLSGSKLPEILKNTSLPAHYLPSIKFHPLADGNDSDHDQNCQSNQNFFDIAERMNIAIAEMDLYNLRNEETDHETYVSFQNYDMIISDFNITEPLRIGKTWNIPSYAFSAFSPKLIWHMVNVDENTTSIPEDQVGIFDHKNGLPPLFDSAKKFLLNINECLKEVTGLLINSHRDFDSRVAEQLESKQEVPVKYVGPLVPSSPTSGGFKGVEGEILGWLDRKLDKSVIYIAFGSMVTLQPEQIQNIHDALLSIGRPFIWSLRTNQHQHLRNMSAGNCEAGGNLVLPWIPQKTVLQHKSTGVFITHSGWNSVSESIFYGIPMVFWPMKDDQHVNAVCAAENSMGILIPETEINGRRIVMPEEIISAVEKLLSDPKYLENVEEQQQRARSAVSKNGASTKELETLFQ